MTRPALSAIAALAAASSLAFSLQPTSNGPLAPPPNGPRRGDPTWTTLANCTLHAKPGEVMEHATVVFRDGIITAILPPDVGRMGDGAEELRPARVPLGPRIIDCEGLHLYAAFIDPYVEIATPAPSPDSPGLHWNAGVTPQRHALDGPALDDKTAESLRKLGFGAAAISPQGGIFRGSSAVVSLAKPAEDRSTERPPVYKDRAYQALGFELARAPGGFGGGGGGGGRGYPGSQMGAIALIRQTLSDAEWAFGGDRHEALPDESFNALAPLVGHAFVDQYLVFDTSDELEALRAAKVAKEFEYEAAILGCGTEFRRLEAIKKDGLKFILPLTFPKAPDVSSMGKAESVELRELMTWEQAPTNPRRMVNAGITVALTSSKLRDRGEFAKNLRTAIKHGLTEDQALAACTTTPAAMLGVQDDLGTIEAGKRANLILADGPIFAEKTKLRSIYIDGQLHELFDPPTKLEGSWPIEVDGKPVGVSLEIDKDNAITIKGQSEKGKDAKVKPRKVLIEGSRLSFVFDHDEFGEPKGVWISNGVVQGDAIMGTVLCSDGTRFSWTATRQPLSPAIGSWRATEADGAIKNKDDKDGLTFRITADSLTLTFTKDEGEPTVIKADDLKIEGNTVTFTHDLAKLGGEGKSTDTVTIQADRFTGESTLPDGSKHAYKAARVPPEEEDAKKQKEEAERIAQIPEKYGTPFGPYALSEQPAQETLLISNATIWTNTGKGIIKKGWLLTKNGKVAEVGDGEAPKAAAQGARVLDAAGKHVTAGIIDCHSHTGISKGVNEGGQAVTAEVRIADVTEPDDINWYRQLAGGVTAVNNLHGSANAIGGQSQTNKLRWGVAHPDDMHFEGAKPGIKFALGENPRQVNRGPGSTASSRYPQTRMGVETLIRDRFTAAKEYDAGSGKVAKGQSGKVTASLGSSTPPLRRDLELEALAEILRGDRIVHCHSYRQDEILMLTQVARDFKFKIGTFQHILEGYKVADYVRDYSGGGSAFADWWAYKVEVQDAIPEGPPLMHDVGAVVSYNSDSDELARRMNVEAAKAVKYGNLSEEDALKFVTLNPAKQLQVDKMVGSLEVGKDADFAVWSSSPLSTLARCEATYIDGRCYFSLEQDAAARETIAKERQRLIQKLLAEGKDGRAAGAGRPGREGRGGEKPDDSKETTPPSDALLDAESQARWDYFLDLYNRGKGPNDIPGLCGCGLVH